jgi:hypothetical protein
MTMPSEWLTEDRQLLVSDLYAGASAPVVLWGCLGSLDGGLDPVASLAEVNVSNGSTKWRIAWVTPTDLIYVDALKGREGWTAYDSHEDAGVIDELEAWSRPLRAIGGVELVSAQARRVNDYSERGHSWQWTASHQIRFADGTTCSVPLFGEMRDRRHEEAVVRFIGALTSHQR